MDYSHHQFLGLAAAGLCVAAGPLLFHDTAYPEKSTASRKPGAREEHHGVGREETVRAGKSRRDPRPLGGTRDTEDGQDVR